MKKIPVPAFLALIFVGACGGDKPLEGPLKSCQVYITYPTGQCTLCGEAMLDSDRVDTNTFTVTKKEARKAKHGNFLMYSTYDEYAKEICDAFIPGDTGLQLEESQWAALEKGGGCAKQGYELEEWFVFSDGTESQWFTDGSCVSHGTSP